MKQALLRKGKIAIFFFFLLIGDAVSKYYADLWIPRMSYLYPQYPYGGIGIFHDFFGVALSINHVQNRGAAWGLFANLPQLLFYSRIVIASLLMIYTLFFNRQKNRDFPLFLIFTGALGNILDNFFYGHVVDMIHVSFGNYSFPVFNLADMMISIGIFWLFMLSFQCGCKQKNESYD